VSAAVPIDVARRVAAMLAEHGTASPGYLGVKVRMPTPELKDLLRFKEGVLIDEVVSGSPAAVVAIEPGDVILSFEGAPVTEPAELVQMVSGKRPGTVCNLLLLRGDVKISRTVTLGAVPFAYRSPGPSGPAMAAGVNSSADTSSERINAKIRQLEAEITRLQRQLSQER
jgi:serine protease Do